MLGRRAYARGRAYARSTTTQVRIGTSTRANAVEAVTKAAGSALARSSVPTFALVFATPEYPVEALRAALWNTLGHVPFGGCVTPGILAKRDVMPRGVAVGVFDSWSLRVGIGAAGLVSTGARAAGRNATRAALEGMPLPPTNRSRALILPKRTAAT